MMSRAVILFWVCLFSCNLASGLAYAGEKGSSKEELFSLANLAYQDGRYHEAINGYQTIEVKGISNPDVYYNLGNAYAKSGQEGRAILYYEKALKLLKKGDDIKHNIALMQSILAIPPAPTIPKPFWGKALDILTFKEKANISVGLYLATFLALIIYVMGKRNSFGRKVRALSFFLAVLTLISISATALEIIIFRKDISAIVIKATADLHEFPLESGSSYGSIGEGLKLRVMEEKQDWLKVSLPDGVVGWIKKDAARTI